MKGRLKCLGKDLIEDPVTDILKRWVSDIYPMFLKRFPMFTVNEFCCFFINYPYTFFNQSFPANSRKWSEISSQSLH